MAKNELKAQPCPVCLKKTLTLMEADMDVPYFGKVFLFSMKCEDKDCDFYKADVEFEKPQNPTKYTFEITSEKDMNIRFIKSSAATVKIPHIVTISPGPDAEGYVSNIEGLLQRVKKIIEQTRDEAEDNSDRKKAKNMLKKLQNVMWGREKLKIIVEDPTGNSAIISDKAKKTKL